MNFAITAQIKNIKVKYLLLLLLLTMLCMIILGLKLGFISLAWTEIVEILLIKAGLLAATDISSDLVDGYCVCHVLFLQPVLAWA